MVEKIEAATPAEVLSLSHRQLQQMPGVNLDDRLRLVPGFSLFRRNSSLTANPTTQGVSLRGLGSTGASRSLVLWDGVPVNSPFGGWVYWTRIPPELLDRVEVSRSASTSVFGDRAMGGSIHASSRDFLVRALSLGYDAGNRGLHQLSGSGALSLPGAWTLSGAARALTTAGWLIVPESFQGAVDRPADVCFVSGLARADYATGDHRLFLRVDLLAEDRGNGTELQKNSTSLGTAAVHYARALNSSWSLSTLAFHNREEFRASFSAIAANRQTERLTSLQSVPAESTGGAGYLRRGGARWNLLAGGDFHRAEGYSNETQLPTGFRTGGGVQTQAGGFVQTDLRAGIAQLFGGLRVHDTGSSVFTTPSGGLVLGSANWRAFVSAHRGFRAPTLNELFRDFRAGNAVTLANPALRPETLWGVESGVSHRREHWRLSISGFYNEMDALIANVTRSVTPSLITRQRDNVGSARVRGLEAALSGNRGPWLAEFSWLLADSRFISGLRLPQVPRNQGSAMLTWRHRRTLISGGLRASSLQPEDDLNRFLLPGYAVFHLAANQQLTAHLSTSATFENLFDREVIAGFSPTPLLAAPRLFRLSVRFTI